MLRTIKKMGRPCLTVIDLYSLFNKILNIFIKVHSPILPFAELLAVIVSFCKTRFLMFH